MRTYILLAMLLLLQAVGFGQTLEKKWKFSTIESHDGKSLFTINEASDFFTLKDGTFEYRLEAKDNLKASGDYIFQNNLLVLFYDQPND
ncbi:MAG: Na+ dependent nucleoside transporter, partial [Altibacter sp.]|nr:Na+ dependent nucleoside transporter [Altibacter sp.]